MRKQQCIITALLVTLLIIVFHTTCADSLVINEDFSIRNGIKFGMTLEEVNNLETEINNLPSEDIILAYSDTYDLLRYNPKEIMGIPTNNEVSLLYRFKIPDNHKLYEIGYFYGDMKDNIDIYYSNLKEEFIAIYGSPLHDNDGQFFDVCSIMFSTRINADKTFGTDFLGKYCQWLVQFNDCYVDIDLFIENYKNERRLYVGYRALSEEEVNEYCNNIFFSSSALTSSTDTQKKGGDFFDFADEYVRKAVDCRDIEPIDLSATHTKPDEYTIFVDFREGNNNILLIHGDKCRIYYPISDDELLSALFRFITFYSEINKQIPEGGKLLLEAWFSDDKKCVLSVDTINTYYSWATR